MSLPINAPTLITCLLLACGIVASTPVLIQGFRRRGKGINYEHNFLIQRAPQLASFITALFIFLSFLSYNGVLPTQPWLSLALTLPEGSAAVISWLGIAILFSGLIFMIGGWYSLGECFTTDAEILEGHTVRKDGLLKFVMHPAYSGIIQSLLGASLAAVSLSATLLALLVVAPLWLARAKYEERILMETLGQSYSEYAKELRWRRFVPPIFPLGV